ncbi:hypothetical protein [Nostoc sp. CCY 9925]|uniref:hypothetical protein n=1 Tax=Nostoc sp. CCY 9925 TaxID=3103865 RepID=UPI0039C7334C
METTLLFTIGIFNLNLHAIATPLFGIIKAAIATRLTTIMGIFASVSQNIGLVYLKLISVRLASLTTYTISGFCL